MPEILTSIETFFNDLDAFVWGWPLCVLLLGTHIFMTIRTGFIQRKIGTAIKLSVPRDSKSRGDISQFAALATSLAATIGSGNIVGVSTAILAGGPGAVLWMWLTGVFGMATKYSEAYISVKYRVRSHEGKFIGGAMYALERGVKHKKLARVLALIFAWATVIACLGIGVSVQSNSLMGAISSSPLISDASQIPTWLVGIILVVLVGIVLVGGVKSITKVCSFLVPAMAFFYVVSVLIILGINYQFIFVAIQDIIVGAFNPGAIMGGALGGGVAMAINFGLKRGLFSNESGLGSAPIIAAQASTRNPARQALVSMTGTFWDTVVICALTGIMVVTCIEANPDIMAGFLYSNNTNLATNAAAAVGDVGTEGIAVFADGVALVTACLSTIPVFGPLVLLVGLVTFAYSTIIGWSAYADRCLEYIFHSRKMNGIYCVILMAFVFWGCVSSANFVWTISDISNATMTVPNLIAVLALSGIIVKETKHYVYQGHLDDESNDIVITTDDVRKQRHSH